jgi:glycosyltransferase involved in cell wall biosynthesis
MKKTKISIITLTYNNWRLIEQAIESVFNQILEPGLSYEYLIVDDGTADFNQIFVLDLIDKYKYKNINLAFKIIINEVNLGTVKSFNNAIKQSSGDIIIPLSADDEFYDEYVIGMLIKKFSVSNALVLTGIPIRKTKTTYNISTISSQKKLFKSPQKLLKYLLVTGNIISGASTYYRREVFDEIGYFDERYSLLEDYPFYIRCLENGVMIHLFDQPVIRYSVDGVSSSTNMHPKLVQDYELLNSHILGYSSINIFEKRKIIFNRVLDKQSKRKLINVFKYFDQYIYYIFTRFIKL